MSLNVMAFRGRSCVAVLRRWRRFACLATTVALAAPAVLAQQNGAAEPRPIVIVSDFHMGLGRAAGGTWDAKEDFRWTSALRGFLDEVGRVHKDRVDLVIAGDFLELWQPPADIKCGGGDADAGCTVEDMSRIVRRVLDAHAEDVVALAAFSSRGTNRLYILAGNHDSALAIPRVWQLLADAVNAAGGRVENTPGGIWISADGKVLIEHGHQIGSDVNRYGNWPTVTDTRDGREVMVRPWGELFVQRLFNSEEETYPIIDNLSPESAGARFRMADRGLWKSTADVARFIAFNAFETSARQKMTSLGRPADASKPCIRAEAEALGYKLVIGTLAADDSFRRQVEGDTAEAKQLRNDLDAQVKQLPDEEIQHLCAMQVDASTLGAIVEAKFVPRAEVIRKHLLSRVENYRDVSVFVYGHTHQVEEAWESRLNRNRIVRVANSGAFQRLVSEEGYAKRVKELQLSKPEEGLRRIGLETLASCYGVVTVTYIKGNPRPVTRMWHMPAGDSGSFVRADSKKCE